MDLVKQLDALEAQFYGEWEEERAPLVAAIQPLHVESEFDEDSRNAFTLRVMNRFGGAYIPYLFWRSLGRFMDDANSERGYIQEILKAFALSNFEEVEQQKMKSLLVTYFSLEKGFELNKIEAKYLTKVHPDVTAYFSHLREFTEKNTSSTEMYQEKFELVKEVFPDFDILSRPITQLREGI